MNSPLRIVPLGGLGEVGMNCLAVEYANTILVIDCGVTFPDSEPGVDIIHPEFAYLLEHRERVKAVLITHGHEDHIGALPYLLQDLDVPVYGPEYALALARERLAEFTFDKPPRLLPIKPRERLQLGDFEVEPYRVTHSIPDSTGLVLRSAAGTVVHSGDFKIDPAPPDEEYFDLDFVQAVGRDGVRLLLSDSTNVDVAGVAGGEASVAKALERHIKAAPQRIVVSMFGSNVHRLAAVLKLARDCGRHTLLLGRSLQTHARIAEKLGLLPKPLPTYISPEMAQAVPRGDLLVLATGSQAEARAALARIAAGTHHQLKLAPDDTVLLSARMIPGRERSVHAMVSDLERLGVRVVQRYDDPQLHVSGHACRDEQTQLIKLVQPRSFVPVHGTFHHLKRHAELARELGVPEVTVIENGAVLELDDDGMRVARHVESGRVHVQAGNELAEVVLRDRVLMSEVGLVMLTLDVDDAGALRGRPRILTRGVVWEDEERDLLDEVCAEVQRATDLLPLPTTDEALREVACRVARRMFRDELGFRPLTHCVVTGRSA